MVPVDSEKRAGLMKLGRSKFVLLFGVLGWGVPTAIMFALIQAYRDGWDGFLPTLIIALILFPLGGILWGRMMWWMMQRKCEKTAATGMKL